MYNLRAREYPAWAIILIPGLVALWYLVTVGGAIVDARTPKDYTFQVFDLEYNGPGGDAQGTTLVMTWGTGKYYFLGNWTREFKLDHNYTVTTVKSDYAKRFNRGLVILDYMELS